MLTYIQSDSFDEVIEQKTMCACTTLTEDEVVQEIQLRNLSSVQEVMDALHWEQTRRMFHMHGCFKLLFRNDSSRI